MIPEMLPHNDNQPVPNLKFNWLDKILGYGVGLIAAWITISGLYAVFLIYGVLPALLTASGIAGLLYLAARAV